MRTAREKHFWRRLAAPRGTVMLEFALLLPTLLMTGMFLLEMMQFHDAQLMADHTAWRLARIAAVHTSVNKDGKAKVSFPKLKLGKLGELDSSKIVTALLMSTATTGWSRRVDRELGEILTKKLFSKKEAPADLKSMEDVVAKLLDKRGLLRMVENFLSKKALGGTGGRRTLQIAMAAERMMDNDVVTVKTVSTGKLNYPLIAPAPNKSPERVEGHLIQVKVDYPMRNGWLYRYFDFSGKTVEQSPPRVHGRAVMLAERPVENLKDYWADPKKRGSDLAVVWSLFKDFKDKIFDDVGKWKK